MRENESQPQRNQSPDLRSETIFQIYRAYSVENTIQTWSGKHGERESHTDASSDESCNEMREHRWKGRQSKIIKSCSRPRAIEVISPKPISWKPRREGIINGKPATRKTTLKMTKLDPTQGDVVPNKSRNLKKRRKMWGRTRALMWVFFGDGENHNTPER